MVGVLLYCECESGLEKLILYLNYSMEHIILLQEGDWWEMLCMFKYLKWTKSESSPPWVYVSTFVVIMTIFSDIHPLVHMCISSTDII